MSKVRLSKRVRARMIYPPPPPTPSYNFPAPVKNRGSYLYMLQTVRDDLLCNLIGIWPMEDALTDKSQLNQTSAYATIRSCQQSQPVAFHLPALLIFHPRENHTSMQ